MAFRILFDGTVAKHLDTPGENEDAYRIAPARGRVVLSDGASESFDAKSWANLVVDYFLESDPSDEELGSCIRSYEGLYDPHVLSWSKAAAYERGSFATLLIAQDDHDRSTVTVTTLGDSFAVWCIGNDVIETTPYVSADQFTQKPTLLATRPELNSEMSINELGTWSRIEWCYEQHDTCLLLCMTDALGAWLLNSREQGSLDAFERLSQIRDQKELLELVEVERASGAMRRDDVTLIIATLTC